MTDTLEDHGIDPDALENLAEDEGLSNTEIQFVSDMAEKAEEYSERAFCSSKQAAWLRRIAEKVRATL